MTPPSPPAFDYGPGDGKIEGLPRYLQVMSSLRISILRGIYPVGSRIPTEIALCERFKVSRHTVREALRHLRSDGLITSAPGGRPVVAPPSMPGEQERSAGGISQDIFDYVIGTRLRVQAMDMVLVTPALAIETGLPAGEQWLCVKGHRANVDDGRITCWNEYFIRAEFATMGRLFARHVGPILPLLEDMFDERIVRLIRSISALSLSAADAAQFHLPARSLGLCILTRSDTADGRIAMLHKVVRPGNPMHYTIDR